MQKANVLVGGCGGIPASVHLEKLLKGVQKYNVVDVGERGGGLWGHAPPGKFRPSEITSGAVCDNPKFVLNHM